MNVQLFSDIHLEFEDYTISTQQADVVVFAGDINLGIRAIEWMKREVPDKPVLYVLGNHEFYKHKHPGLINKVKEAAQGSTITLLEKESLVIEDVTFHGTTLWTDFNLFGKPKHDGFYAQSYMSDYKRIRREPSYSKIRSVDVYMIHTTSLNWLTESLKESTTDKNVVITHHAPSPQSLPEDERDDKINVAYASNLEEWVLQHQPDFWLHGHIHAQCSDYMIGNSRVISNPRGYPDSPNPKFNKELIIQI